MKTKVEYRIPGIIWFVIAVLTFLVGAFFQKNLILQGNTKFLGLISFNKKINNTALSVTPTKIIYQKFNLQKDLGTIQPLGDKNAKVKLVLFSDFECSFCGALAGYNQDLINNLTSRNSGWQPAIPNIISDYVDTGLAVLYFRDYPAHKNSDLMSNAGRCANEQNSFWEMHDKLFAFQDEGGIGDEPNSKMLQIASDLGLDTDQFSLCLKNRKYESEIAGDMKRAKDLGISGTPHMFINDKYVVGVEPYEKYKKIIDEELKK